MSQIDLPVEVEQSCWNAIGVWGNGSCPELGRVGHCRNCEVYAAGGRKLLDRVAPDDYIDLWTELLAEDKTAVTASTTAYVVFRLGRTWFALRAKGFREITEPTGVRMVPRRAREILLGLVNVRGELYPCVSLHVLFGEASVPGERPRRFMVIRRAGEDWVVPADEVEGLHEVDEHEVEPLPATLTHADVVYSHGLFRRGDRTVAIIDEDLLYGALARGIA